jgi:hypothetical protein
MVKVLIPVVSCQESINYRNYFQRQRFCWVLVLLLGLIERACIRLRGMPFFAWARHAVPNYVINHCIKLDDLIGNGKGLFTVNEITFLEMSMH